MWIVRCAEGSYYTVPSYCCRCRCRLLSLDVNVGEGEACLLRLRLEVLPPADGAVRQSEGVVKAMMDACGVRQGEHVTAAAHYGHSPITINHTVCITIHSRALD